MMRATPADAPRQAVIPNQHGLLVPRTRRIAAVALIVFLIAVLPANIHAAQAGVALRGAPAMPIGPRVALQLLFIGLLWWSGVRSQRARYDAAQTPSPGRRVA